MIIKGDTVVVLTYPQLKTLNQRITLLSAHKLTCDYTVQRADSIISDYKKNEIDLRSVIVNKDLELQNKDKEIVNLNEMRKKTRKKWIKNALYFSGGSAVVGVLVGVLIAK